MKKLFPIALLLVILVAGGIVFLLRDEVKNIFKSDNENVETNSNTPAPEQKDLNTEKEIEDTKVYKEIGIKYWDQDEDPAFIIGFTIDSDYVLKESDSPVPPTVEVDFGAGNLSVTISHAGFLATYTDYVELTHENTGENLYRVELEDGQIMYDDEVTTTGSCTKGEGGDPVAAPCGVPVYNYLIITCSSQEVAPQCDEVMKTIVKKDYL